MSIDLEDSLAEFSYSLQNTIILQDTFFLKETIQERLAEHLFSQHPESYDFLKLASVFAYLGTEQHVSLKNEVVQLFSTPNGIKVRGQDGTILPIKKGGASKFWKEHKTEIIIGIAIVALITTVVIIAAYSAGGAGAAAAGGGLALNDLQDSLDKKAAPKPKQHPPTGDAIPEPTLPSPPSIPETSHPATFPEEQADRFPLPPPPMRFVPKQFLPEEAFPYQPPSAPPSNPSVFETVLKDFPASREEAFPEKEGPKLSTIPPDLEPPPKNTFFDPDAKIPPHPARFGKGSSIFKTVGKPLPSHQGVGFIPGINNLPEDAYAHAERISGFAQGYSIDGIDNSTHSAPVDIAETLLLNYQGVPTSPSFLIKETWVNFHKDNAQYPEAKYLQLCHSQGAAHVKNALLMCPEEIRERVIVVAIAPAAIIPKDLCYDSYNYASKKDLIPYGKFTANLLTDPIKAVKDFEELKELIILEPHPDAKGADHGLDSLTYAPALKRHIDDYLEEGVK